MAQRFVLPFAQPLDGNSAVMPGAKLYFYQTGTSTPLDTYSDDDLTVANTNPVVADADGVFGDIFLKAQSYKAILKTSADVTEWTADPIVPVVTSADLPLAVASGGTGATSAADARTALDVYSTTEADAAFEAADADILKADTSDNLTVGFTTDEYAHGEVTTGTVTVSLTVESVQTLTNGGAFTLAPPASGAGHAEIWITNNASAGAITTSGFTAVTGDTYATTDAKVYLFQVAKSSAGSLLNVVEVS